MTKLKGFIDRGLAATAELWGPIRVAYGWVHRAARILGAEGATGAEVRGRLGGLLGAVRRREVTAAELAGADRSAWRALRAELDGRRQRRVDRRRFRRDPEGYLRDLEAKLNQPGLPA